MSAAVDLARLAAALRSLAADPPDVTTMTAAALTRAGVGLRGRSVAITVSRNRSGVVAHLRGPDATRAARELQQNMIGELRSIREQLTEVTKARLR